MSDRKSQAGDVRLLREEGVEDVGNSFRRDTAARVLNSNLDERVDVRTTLILPPG